MKIMLPAKENNIYPKNTENLKVLFEYYFDDYDLITDYEEAIIDMKARTSLKLNQIEYISQCLSKAWQPIFLKDFKRGTTLKNLLRYGIDAFTKKEKEWSLPPYSKGRITMKNFIDFISNEN